MAIIDLTFDQKRKLYSLPVLLSNKSMHGSANAFGKSTDSAWYYTIMYLDTGSNLTSITENEVDKLNLDRSTFQTQKVGGIGGFVELLTTKEVGIKLMSNGNSMLDVKLDIIGVHENQIKKKIRKKTGAYVQRGNEVMEMICLFGLDALEKLGGKLEIDMKNKSGKIII
ncbi:MAG: hypothetical protein MPI47_07930 [Cuniculiplasma sp.]|jgi:hypothetical protein|nr:hypothetical protein [Cuniculiplasma sp.]